MRVNRGDIVLVYYPFTTGGAKVRSALVVHNDRDNARITNTIVAQISDNSARVDEATQHLIELSAEPGRGLARASALVATNLLTMHQSDILRVLESLSAATMAQIVECLRVALGLPRTTPSAGNVQVTVDTPLAMEVEFLVPPIGKSRPRSMSYFLAALHRSGSISRDTPDVLDQQEKVQRVGR